MYNEKEKAPSRSPLWRDRRSKEGRGRWRRDSVATLTRSEGIEWRKGKKGEGTILQRAYYDVPSSWLPNE
jgi:hypothetical protein